MLSGSCKNSVVSGLAIEYSWSGTQSQSGNYTDIDIDVKLTHVSLYVSSTKCYVYVDGELAGSITVASMNGNRSNTEGSVSARVYHNSDGTKNVTIEAVWDASFTYSGVGYSDITASKTFELDTILRTTKVTSASDIVLGNSCKVVWTPQSSSLVYKLKFSYGTSWSYTTGFISPGTTSAYTYSGYTPPLETIAPLIPDSSSAQISVMLYTYPDTSSSSTGSSSTSFIATIPSTAIPTLGTISVSIDNSSNDFLSQHTDIALAGYSRVKITASASGIYGSTIKSFTISGSVSSSVSGESLNYTTSVITSSGNKQFTITCTDSRGRTSSSETSSIVQFLEYTPPVINSFIVENDTSSSSSSGTAMKVTADWEINSIGGYNTATSGLYYKASTATDWTYYTGGTLNDGVALKLNVTFSDDKSYNFRVVVTDALGNSAQEDTFASTTQVLMDFRSGGKGLGIGKISEQDAMEVAMKSVFYGDMYIGNNETSLDKYIDDRIPTDLAKNSDLSAVDDKVTNLSSTVDTLSTSVNNKIEIKLLWTNSSPTSTFAAQTVKLSLSSYTHVGIIFKQAYSVDYYFPMAIYLKSISGTFAVHSNGTLTRRNITTISDSGVSFSSGFYYDEGEGAEQASNGSVVPYKIYGIKGVT